MRRLSPLLLALCALLLAGNALAADALHLLFTANSIGEALPCPT
jgi:hypothetical protein